jgi:hypothetical protein
VARCVARFSSYATVAKSSYAPGGLHMASGKLNSLSIERAHRFGGPVLLSDGDGLYFRKQTREGAAWLFRYRFAGRERWMTLGNFPDMSLAAACARPWRNGVA